MRIGAQARALAGASRSLRTPPRPLAVNAAQGMRWKSSTAKNTAGKNASAAAEPSTPAPTPIPSLPRPLGVEEPPVASMTTFVKKSDKVHDNERRLAERKVLMKEATQGYFHDYNTARRGTGGKLWTAPKVLIREDMARYFPNIAGTALTGEKVNTTELTEGKTSLVAIVNTRLSEEHVESFVRETLDDQEGNENFNFIQINHQANLLKATLLAFATSGLKRQIPQDLWGKYIMSRGEWSRLDVTEPMMLDNKILGYVYLVDANCKIRWAGCGLATPEEADHLRAATAVLLRRQGSA